MGRGWKGMLACVVIMGGMGGTAPYPGLAPAMALTAGPDAFLPTEQEILLQVETYLNNVGTVRARFLQVSGTGVYAEGTVFLSRPGRMRLEYDPPSPLLIVADGRHLIYYDAKLEQTSYIGLETTPAGILLRVPVRLKGDVTVMAIHRVPGAVEVSLIQTRDPSAGELTLLFSEKPFALKQWRVRDAQGQTVTVSLYDAETDVKLDPKLFTFTDQKFFKPHDS
ncbi:MAG: Outer membrane lipoprotein-sorting protein [Rhodospirillaceae bacterium]|nr:MAG: Outer membrane lipoprotein-sorting protein [Rhodospirillaceae bacterium]